MDLSLSKETELLLKDELESGRFSSLDELIITAVGQLRQQNELERFERLRADIRLGYEQCERGECVPLDMEKIRERAQQKLARKA